MFDELWEHYPTTTLTACGRAVGLPEGQMGNSEVGHLNLGAGSVVMQDLTRIDEAVEHGELAENEMLREAFTGAERVHLIGLVSDGGVHSSLEPPAGADRAGGVAGGARSRPARVHRRARHAADVGRRLPGAGAGAGWRRRASGRIGSVVGRYYAMDRDRRWERMQRAYDLLVHGRAEHRADTGAGGGARPPTSATRPTSSSRRCWWASEARIRPGDSVLGINFRPDRMREITQALADPEFTEVDRGGAEPVERYATMTEYEEGWPYPVAFPPQRPATTLPAVIAARGERQLHVAETEKYPHVTYFFSGGEETPTTASGANWCPRRARWTPTTKSRR